MDGLDFRKVFDASANAYMLLDPELRYVAANRAYLALTGSRLEELVGRTVEDAFPDGPESDNARLLMASFQKVLSTRAPDHLAIIQYRVPTTPGGPPEDRFWSATHTPILGDDGRVAFILQHTMDVTEVERLRRSESGPMSGPTAVGLFQRAQMVQAANLSLDSELRRLRQFYEQAPNFVAILRGPTHVFELTNAAYRRLVGHRQLTGLDVRTALPEIADQGFPELLDRVFETGEPFVGRAVPVRLQRVADGPVEDVVLDFIYQPILDADGKVAGIFVQGSDITSERRIEAERDALLVAEQSARAEAERANRLKDEFLATVSHELRTPLTSIMGWLQILRTGQLDEARRTRALETIDRNGRALAQLVDDMLDVSRIMSGKLKLEVESVRVADPVEAAIEAVRPMALAKDVRIQSTLDSSAMVMGDASRLQQIFWNLLTNSVKFSTKGGKVTVVVEVIESSVCVSVLDRGQGIAQEFLPHVFERFRQAEGGSARRLGGLGLGLSIVKHLVELHGGFVTVESEGEGRGALFRVVLPVALTRQLPSLAAPRAAPSFDCPKELAGLRILVVEDEHDTRELLREILTSCGAKVALAASAAEGLAAFAGEVPDVLISDIGMPNEDGHTFIRKIRALPEEKGGKVPAIALTAFARTEDRTHALRSGFRAHVPKPIDVGELLAVIASLAGN